MSEISEKAIKLIKDLRRDISIDIMFTPKKNAEDESLKALIDYIAELESAQRWRVVADGELPEFGTSILFYDSILEKINKGTCTALDRDKTNLHWITDDGLFYHGNRCEYITRWMPLPEPPEVQDV